MFQSESAETSITISDMNAITTLTLLIFLYSGDLAEYTDDYIAKQVYDAATKYEMSTLKTKCISYLHSNMTKENVSGILLFADEKNETELYQNALKFLDSCNDEVFTTNGWKLLFEYNPHLAAKCLQELLMMRKSCKR
ncbi:speckle-type POZ protein B-like [Stegodyphus dumicola]|uniref:speckle-type POZ protein B-like n=1 Tax=Stegodyphus dumicola TaxID=202533 RepID=UPI0015A84CCD|nr:speckle-type POZ protein B-like [Stegodyphus dumicola]